MIGFTSGTFSIPHAGHVLFLNECRKHCDKLHVILANDEQIRYKKGKVIVSAKARLEFFKSLRSVDIVSFSQGKVSDSLDELFEELLRIKPDVYFCNEDAFDLELRRKFCRENKISMTVFSRKNNNAGVSSSDLYS